MGVKGAKIMWDLGKRVAWDRAINDDELAIEEFKTSIFQYMAK